MSKHEEPYSIHGSLTDAQGKELSGADVMVWWRRIREPLLLANGRADEEGKYHFHYQPPDDAPGRVLINVEVRSPRLETRLQSAPTEAKPELQIDLHAVPRDRSEYSFLLASIVPLLDGLPLTDVVESDEHKDLSFLAQETGKSTEQILRVVICARMEEAYKVPAPAFFAFLRQQIPSSLPKPLIDATAGFTLVEGLVQHIATLLFALSPDLQTSTLQTAINQGLIATSYRKQIPGIVQQLQSHRATDLLAQPYLVGKAGLGDLLTLAAIPTDKQAVFAAALAQNTRSMSKFWALLADGQHGFTAAETATIQRTLSLGVFVKNHLPLVQTLVQGFADGNFQHLSDLARLGLPDWEKMVNQTGPPPSIDGAGAANPSEVFARVVYARVTRAYPTVALAARITTGNLVPPAEQGPLIQFFQNNATLNLLRHSLSAFLGQEGDKAFAGIAEQDRPVVVANTRRLQRVLYISPEVDVAHNLITMGIRSATQITMMGSFQFFQQATQAGLSKRQANQAYNTSAQRYASLLTLYTQFNREALGLLPQAIGKAGDSNGPISNAIAKDQSLATLFGSQDYCEVDSCTSILSPAAYLCDLLYWLRFRMTGVHSALDTLNTRRPDIGNLKLNCPNTETALPYIDLVNEILADAISVPVDPHSTINPIWKQTSMGKTPEQLRAAPEYFNQAAFVKLFTADYPHSLPYSEGLDELRAYLKPSGVALWQLRKALLPIHAPTPQELLAVAAERFTIAPHGIDILSAPNFIAATVAWHTLNPPVDLSPVPVFIHAAAITYDQLQELLGSGWVEGGLGMAIKGINDSCDTSVQTLSPSPLDAGFLDRTHRFLRLWRASGWLMWELDLLMQSAAVVNGTLDGNGLTALGGFRLLQDSTKLAADAQLAWFQPMDIASHRAPGNTQTTPLYSRVFLNPAVVSLHPDGDLVAISTGAVLTDNNLNHHTDAIQAALGLSDADAAMLVSLFGLDAAGTLTLANLSLLYRITQLATAAKLSIGDLQTLAHLVDPGAANLAAALQSPFASLAAATDFLAQVKAIKQSGFSIDALQYLLTPPAGATPLWTATTAITETAIGTALAAIRQAILNPSGGNVNGSVIAAVALQFALANDLTAFVLQQINLPGTAQTLLAVLTDPAITNPAGGPYPDPTRANYPNQYAALQLVDKIRVIVVKLHLVNADLSWLVTNTALYGGLNFGQLPVLTAQPTPGAVPLLNTVLLVKLARSFVAAPPAAPVQTLYDLITGVNSGTLATAALAQAALSTITGWPLADIVDLTGALGIAWPADYTQPAAYDALRTLEAMIGAMAGKASAAQLISWGGTPADEPTAEALAASALSVLKSRYSNPDWLTAAPAIVNPLREHRSAALQDYLVGNGDHAGNSFGDLNSLFDFFLIDTQMSSCEVSTRVVQAYIAVQIFVERCRMGLEAPAVQINPNDDAWEWWTWMKRYRIWQAAREVFLYPENWLVESQRPTRTEVYKKLEQDVHQNDYTSENFETVLLNYVDGLENVAHLHITGTCKDPANGNIHVIGRTRSDPPHYYHRTLQDGTWSGWVQIPLDVKSQQAVPAVFGGRLCLFWPEIKVQNEPRQNLPAAQPSNDPPSQERSKYVTIGISFSSYRNKSWAPVQSARGKLFDVPLLSSDLVSHSQSVESLYTLKVNPVASSGSYGSSLNVDVFRLGAYDPNAYVNALQSMSADFATAAADLMAAQELEGLSFLSPLVAQLAATYEAAATAAQAAGNAAAAAAATAEHASEAVQIGRAGFDGRLHQLEQRNLSVLVNAQIVPLLSHAQSTYGPDALPLLPLPDNEADPNLTGEPSLVPRAGSLVTLPADPNQGSQQNLALNFTGVPPEIGAGPLLNTAPVPFRVVGPDTDLFLDPASYFFYQDSRRCYYVDAEKWYWNGSTWTPNPPSNPASAPYEARYFFHRFYHPYTRLIWHQLASSGFPGLYDPALQQNPDQIDPSHADVFSFQQTYQPVLPTVHWGEDNEILDFSPDAAYSIYNWELFFHNPLYVAGLLSQNQQFEDATKWFHYIFDPTRQGSDPAPQRFWIPKPLHDLTSPAIVAQRINNLLTLVNQGDPNALAQVLQWRKDPFDPYLLADLRPVAYMKNVVMQYLDNLIAWADYLFATDSREALSEATLLYVIAAEILGPLPNAVTPPQHADDSYNELAPNLDAFANALVDIENVLGPGGGGSGGGGGGNGVPGPQTFYFKIPPNDKLLGYWGTVADRLNKLRHCQNLQGATRSLALFDAPIDPGLLVKAQAAGMDLGSVLSDIAAPLPNYRYTYLYTQASDFVNAVRAYGGSLLGAIEKSDGAALNILQQTIAQDIQHDMDQVFQWNIDKAQHDLDALNQALAIVQAKLDFNNEQGLANAAEWVGMIAKGVSAIIKTAVAATHATATVVYLLPEGTGGATGAGGTPHTRFTEGGKNAGDSAKAAGFTWSTVADLIDAAGTVATTVGGWQHRLDMARENVKEAQIQLNQTLASIASSEVLLSIAEQNQINHGNQIDYIQKQLDYYNFKFTNQDLYDWQVGQLADTYFQSYKLAYRMCKQVERCYQFELGITDSNFIQFGYWDSLRKGLLAGETLNNDLRRMQASYLDQNKRRYELSRYISLTALDPAALQALLVSGACDFDLPESLFDNDYPGHYNRHIQRMSVTIVYPSPGKFDNIKATLTLTANRVRVSTTATGSGDYAEVGPADPRFIYNYAAISQKIALGNGQDDPGLFQTSLSSNLGDNRYLPFEGAGAVSSWHFEMPVATNDIDLSTVSDVVFHLYYTAMDGDVLKNIVVQYNLDNAPAAGVKVFSARNDFGAPSPTVTNPYPLSPWDSFLQTPAVGDPDQTLVLGISASKFPAWTRGKAITITAITVLAIGWPPESFRLEPQAPLVQNPADLAMAPVGGATEPNVCSANLVVPPNTVPGKWSFKLSTAGAGDFRALTKNDVGDVLLLVGFQTA